MTNFKMSENKSTSKKSVSPDWLVRGVLTKIGETFDRLTGRNWKPSSSLATSELIERIKTMLDAETKETDGKGKFVPHNIKLKMQWDKFSTDAEDAMRKLEHELLTAAVDHINDRRYHTYAPIQLEIKPDYFTEGVKLMTSFGKFAEESGDAAVSVSVPDLKNIVIAPAEETPVEIEKEIFTFEFTVQNKTKFIELAFAERERKSVGRTKENDLSIDDQSVSKIHAALVLNSDNELMVADTGSTNGTFINGQRIAYGKGIIVKDTDKLKFGNIKVELTHVVKEVEPELSQDLENDFETKDYNAEIAPEEDISESKTVSDNKTIIIEPVAGVKENYSTAEDCTTNKDAAADINAEEHIKTEEQISVSAPRIVLDFNENKE